MNSTLCITCRSPQTVFVCPLCNEPICKNCVYELAPDAFAFRSQSDPKLSHLHYCQLCFDSQIAPELEQYAETLERAREVFFFFTTQKKHFPLIRRAKKTVEVPACDDRDETILRLGFLAAEQGFNAIIQAEVTAKKVRNEGYQTSRWHGVGTPAQVDADKLNREDE